MAFFNAEMLPALQKEYVCYIDILGIQSKMIHSLSQTANYMFKLHATILEAWRTASYNSISVYPIMDGAYITSTREKDILNLITYIYCSLCQELLVTEFKFWFLIRASIAYGNIIHGRNIPYDASLEFASRVGYKEELLIGEPMISAYNGERLSAPMGIYIDKSASLPVTGIPDDWKWYANDTNTKEIEEFKCKLQEYYDWLEKNGETQGYNLDKQHEHLQIAKDYFNF